MKKIFLAAGLILLVAAGCNKAANNSDQNSNPYSSQNNSQPSNNTTTPPATSNSGSTGTTQKPPADSVAYTQALKTYGTNRIQFDSTCQARPAAMVFKSGTKVMLDNRSISSRKIMVGTVSITVPAYDWRVVTMPLTAIQKTLYVNCDTSKNVATITLQK